MRDRRQAQQAAEALPQALEELGLPETLVSEIEGRLQSQQKLLSKIVGVMFPALFGCRTPSELCRVSKTIIAETAQSLMSLAQSLMRLEGAGKSP